MTRKLSLIIILGLLYSFSGYSENLPLYLGKDIQVVVPECALDSRSLRVENSDNQRHFHLWTHEQNIDSYDYLQKIAHIWKEQQEIPYYLVFGKDTLNTDSSKFGWEIVPFQKTDSRVQLIWNQLKVIWRIGFGLRCSTIDEQKKIADLYPHAESLFSGPFMENTGLSEVKTNDPFCEEEVIEKQYIYKGDKMLVLYNYAPINPHHFMIIPKAHRTTFSDLTLEEYLEASEIATKLIQHFKQKGYSTVYLFHKSGKEAGQSVYHWHEHVVFPEPGTEESLGKNMLTMIGKKLFFNSSTVLSDEELKERVMAYREELQSKL